MSASIIEDVQIEKIRPNPANIRDEIDTDGEAMQRLASEVATLGIVSPLLVYPHPQIEGDYMVQEGHRRRLAALRVGLSTVPCIIREAPARGELADLEVMMTTGRNHQPLTALEEARGFQRMLDLGLNESTIGKKFKRPKSEVLAKARLAAAPEPVRNAYGHGLMDLEQAKALQDLEDAGKADVFERVVEKLDAEAGRGWKVNVSREIHAATLEVESERETERLTAMGAKAAPMDVGYSGKFDEADNDLTDQEHIDAGHVFKIQRHGDGEVHWYAPRAQAKAAASEEEKAEKHTLRALAGGLAISFRVRREFLVEQVRSKDGGVDEATDKEMLLELLWPELARLDDELLGDISGIHKPADADLSGYGEGWQKYQDWKAKVKARFATFSWRQLTRAYALREHQDTDKQLRYPKNFDRSVYEWSFRKRWLDRVQAWFGYRLDQSEQDTLEHFKAKGGSYGQLPKGADRNPDEDVEVL